MGPYGVGLSAFDIDKERCGYTQKNDVYINRHTVQETIATHAKARNQFQKCKLNWRCGSGPRRALGWIPFKTGGAKFKNGPVVYSGKYFKIWDSYGLSQYDFKSGSFSEDARGRWYFNVVVEMEIQPCTATGSIGIDLGLGTTAVCSDGTRFEAGHFYRENEKKLGIAQWAGKKGRARNLNTKTYNQRKDVNQKFTTQVLNQNAAVFIGNVSSTALVKTPMAKSVYDAGWGMMKSKAITRSAWVEEVDESYTTQTCSSCGPIPPGSPKGRAGLGIREWTCTWCGTQPDRDINAAQNILAL